MVTGLKKRRRVWLIVISFALIISSAVLIGFGLGEDGVSFFRSPSQVRETTPPADTVFRLGGLVKEGSLRGQGDRQFFTITDRNADIPVVYQGFLPDIFREGQGVIAKGRLRDGQFIADEILAKHDENYMPKEVVDALKEQGVFRPEN